MGFLHMNIRSPLPATPHITSEFILLADLKWDITNPPEFVTQQFGALNLFQIISIII